MRRCDSTQDRAWHARLLAFAAVAMMFLTASCTSRAPATVAQSSTEDAGLADTEPPAIDAAALPQPAAIAVPDHVVLAVVTKQKYADSPATLAIAVPVEFASPSAPDQRVTLMLLLDTGSSGVSVFAESLAGAGVVLDRVGAKQSITYGGGDVYEEQNANSMIGLGDLRTSQPILISIVDNVHCAPNTSCGGAAGSSYLTKQGFHGILGLGTRFQGDVFSPISQLPGSTAKRYALNTKSGSLILNPTDDEAKDFTRYALPLSTQKHPNGAAVYDDRTIPICADVGETIKKDCAPGLMDSGTWSLFFAGVNWSSAAVVNDDGTLKANTALAISVDGLFNWTNTPIDDVIVSSTPFLGGFSRILGMPFFQAFDVLYDLNEGTLGVRPAR